MQVGLTFIMILHNNDGKFKGDGKNAKIRVKKGIVLNGRERYDKHQDAVTVCWHLLMLLFVPFYICTPK